MLAIWRLHRVAYRAAYSGQTCGAVFSPPDLTIPTKGRAPAQPDPSPHEQHHRTPMKQNPDETGSFPLLFFSTSGRRRIVATCGRVSRPTTLERKDAATSTVVHPHQEHTNHAFPCTESFISSQPPTAKPSPTVRRHGAGGSGTAVTRRPVSCRKHAREAPPDRPRHGG